MNKMYINKQCDKLLNSLASTHKRLEPNQINSSTTVCAIAWVLKEISLLFFLLLRTSFNPPPPSRLLSLHLCLYLCLCLPIYLIAIECRHNKEYIRRQRHKRHGSVKSTWSKYVWINWLQIALGTHFNNVEKMQIINDNNCVYVCANDPNATIVTNVFTFAIQRHSVKWGHCL